MRLRLLLILVVCLLGCVPALAATPFTRSWGKLYDMGAHIDDVPEAITVDASGNLYVVTTVGSSGFNWWYVQKFDPYGTLLWTHSTYFFGFSIVYGIATDTQHNVIVVGETDNGSSYDGVIYKLSNTGFPVWFKLYDGAAKQSDGARAVTTDANDNVFVSLSEDVAGGTKTRMIEYSPNGSVLGSHVGTLDGQDVMFATNQRYLVWGDSYNHDNTGFYIYDKNGGIIDGEEVPVTVTNGTLHQNLYLMATAPTGEVYVATDQHTSDSNGLTNNTTLTCYGTNGAVVWQTFPINGHPSDLIAPDKDHVYLVLEPDAPSPDQLYRFNSLGGQTLKINTVGSKLYASDNGAFFAVSPFHPLGSKAGIVINRCDVDGVSQWSTTYLAPNSQDTFLSAVAIRNGEIYVAGQSKNVSDGKDILLLKYTEGVALKAMGLAQSQLSGPATIKGTVTLNAPAPVGGFAVQLFSSNPSAAGVPSSLTIPSGATYATFNVTVTAVDANYSAVINARAAGVQRWDSMLLVPATISMVAVNPTSVNGGTPATGTVTLSSVTGPSGRTVLLSSSDPAVKVPSSIYVAPNSKSKTFTATTTAVGSTKTVTITATLAGTTKTTQLTVN